MTSTNLPDVSSIFAAVEAAPIDLVRAFVENEGLNEFPMMSLTDGDCRAATVGFLLVGIEEGAITEAKALEAFGPGGACIVPPFESYNDGDCQ